MACSIIRNKQTNEIEQVLAPNGKESKLYKDILKINPDKEAALRAWAQVYTPSFKAWFGDWEVGKTNQVYETLGVKSANISFNIESFGKSIDNIDIIKDGKKIGYAQISKNNTSKTLTVTGIELKEK